MFLEKVYTGRNQWYYYVFTLLIVIFTWQFIGVIPLVVYTFFHTPELLYHLFQTKDAEMMQKAITTAMQTNTGLALTLLAFIFGMAGLFLSMRYIQGKRPLDIITGRMKIDWKRILFGAGIWAVLSIFNFMIPYAFTDTSDLIFQFEPVNFFILLVISLTLLPLQASFEELLFRGYLMQWIVYLFKYRWIAFLLTGILFGLMHAANPETGMGFWIVMPQYILMGLILSYMAVKDDGLELALGLHISNNVLAAITITSANSALQTHALFRLQHPTASHWETLSMLACGILFIWIGNYRYHFIHKINLWEKIKH